MAVLLGLNAKLLNDGTEVTNVKDLTLSLETGEADVTTRAANGWREYVGTLKEATLEFGMLYDTEDADYQAFSAAFLNNTPMNLSVTDGNGNGLTATWSITGFSWDQNLEEAQQISVTARITSGQNAPSWGGSTGA